MLTRVLIVLPTLSVFIVIPRAEQAMRLPYDVWAWRFLSNASRADASGSFMNAVTAGDQLNAHEIQIQQIQSCSSGQAEVRQ